MEYFKCLDCWRVYEYRNLISRSSCKCGGHRFRESQYRLLNLLFTDFKTTVNNWFKHEKAS